MLKKMGEVGFSMEIKRNNYQGNIGRALLVTGTIPALAGAAYGLYHAITGILDVFNDDISQYGSHMIQSLIGLGIVLGGRAVVKKGRSLINTNRENSQLEKLTE